ncbi:hypothetical protein B0H14DRAFT_55021 [Mycena olivaceomarginata]|nr:hypothetical protein B0H14DRAFT_55021 [Mycena olivaceomarginata]
MSDKDGSTSLHIASQNTHLEVVKFLVEKGTDINASWIDRPASPSLLKTITLRL